MDYDVEIDKLIKFLFPEGLQDEYQDNQEFINYINKLGSFKAEQLAKEEKALDEEKSSINNHTRHLTLTHYKTFIQTADCSHRLYKDVCSVGNDIRAFMSETPKLLNECEKSIHVLWEIKEKRRRNSSILSNCSKILQILEIPQVMNTCIQNEFYEEALTLPSFVKRLASKHGDIPLINCIVKNVEKSWWELQQNLLSQLTTDISLPRCLQIIGYLRRMNIFSETELRLQFLQARGSWFDSILASVSSEDKSQHLSYVIDVTRVNIFSIATQYNAIFTDDEMITNSNDFKNSIFCIWLNKRINDFLATVESDLPFCSSSSLDSLLGQCMYFGQSFGRIGADFRGLIVDPFTKTVEQNFRSTISQVDEQFDRSLKEFVLPKAISSISVNVLRSEMKSETKNLTPPACLLDYYPLVEYCNGILTAFNDLRYCNPYACSLTVTTVLQKSLEKVSSNLLSYFEKEHLTWFDKEREIFSNLCECYLEKFVPFVQCCLTTLYDPQIITKYFGFSITEMENESVIYLNIAKIRNCVTWSNESREPKS